MPAPFEPGVSRSMLRYRYVSWLRGDTLQPGENGGITSQIEASFIRDVRVSVEGDVRNRVAPTGEEVVGFEVALHDTQRVVPELLSGFERSLPFLCHLDVGDMKPGAGHGDVRLVGVLLDVLPGFTEITPCVSSNPSNTPVISASPSAYMVTL